jgi:hypothetical protein
MNPHQQPLNGGICLDGVQKVLNYFHIQIFLKKAIVRRMALEVRFLFLNLRQAKGYETRLNWMGVGLIRLSDTGQRRSTSAMKSFFSSLVRSASMRMSA